MPRDATISCLALAGAQTIRTVAATRLAVLDGLTAPEVELDCSAVDEVDVTFIQLLLSLRRSAVEGRKRLTVTIPGGSPLAAALASAGIDPGQLSVTPEPRG